MINIDNNIANSDWIKQRTFDLPANAKAVLNTIGGAEKWEHFKTLPAYQPMPESLRNEVEALVRESSKAHNPDLIKYNPDQPRDERGRFTDGMSSATPEERVERFQDRTTFEKGKGVLLTGKELRAAKLKYMQQMVVHTPYARAGSTDEDFNDPEGLFQGMKDEAWRYNNFDMRVLKDGFIYANGPIQIQATHPRYLEDGLEQVVSVVERLQEANPVNSLDIRIGERGMPKGAYATAHLGGSLMNLSPTNLLDPKTMNEIDPRGEAASGWFMPATASVTPIEGSIAHEWGHLLDRSGSAKRDFFTQNEQLVKDNISRYGFKKGSDELNWTEAYPELYSEWFLTGGQTSNPAVQAAGKAFQW